jgi:nitrite reductase/ring-hydroxylating ferredoxin subunit
MITTASPEPIEINELGEIGNLADRVLAGEVLIKRRGLQKVGLFDELVEASVAGIRESVGAEIAANAKAGGFDRIHERVEAGGWVAGGRPVCPLHNVSFGPKTGVSACAALHPLKTYSFEVRDDRLHVDTVKDAGNAEEPSLA